MNKNLIYFLFDYINFSFDVYFTIVYCRRGSPHSSLELRLGLYTKDPNRSHHRSDRDRDLTDAQKAHQNNVLNQRPILLGLGLGKRGIGLW